MWELQLLDDDRLAIEGGVVVDYQQLRLTERLYRHDEWRATFDDTSESIGDLQQARFVRIAGPNIVCLVDLVERNTATSTAVSGTCGGGKFTKRLIIPPSGETHDVREAPAETRMRGYVNDHAGPGADASRQLPGLTVADDQARGTTAESAERYSLLSDVLTAIGEDAEIGWQTVLDGTDVQWRPIVGRDLTDDVIFDVDFDSATAQRLLDDFRDLANMAYVAGPGEGLLREIQTRHVGATEPTGWDRDEAFVDASDADDSTQLPARGDEYLAAHTRTRTFEIDVATDGAFLWNRDWLIGDVVTGRARRWGITVPLRIVEIVHTVGRGGVTQAVTLGVPWPDSKPTVSSAPSSARR